MKKIFPKVGLFLFIVANASPVLAASKYQNASLSRNPQQTIVALSFGDIVDGVEKLDKKRRRIEKDNERKKIREQRERERQIKAEMQQREREQRLRERQARQDEMKRRQEEYAAARRAATQRQLQEAERRRQYFQSLSPEQKQAYLKQQQALRQKQAEAGLFLLGLIFAGGGSSSQQQTQDYHYINQTPTSSYNPAPAPVTPVGGNDFYGTGPGGSFYGN